MSFLRIYVTWIAVKFAGVTVQRAGDSAARVDFEIFLEALWVNFIDKFSEFAKMLLRFPGKRRERNFAGVAQVVERGPEKPGVPSASLGPGT